jgi:hypothetical protein
MQSSQLLPTALCVASWGNSLFWYPGFNRLHPHKATRRARVGVAGFQAVVDFAFKGGNTGFPVRAPPILVKGDFSLCFTNVSHLSIVRPATGAIIQSLFHNSAASYAQFYPRAVQRTTRPIQSA